MIDGEGFCTDDNAARINNFMKSSSHKYQSTMDYSMKASDQPT